MANHPNRKKEVVERAVVVTTEHRGVFFGYAEDTSGDVIQLKKARNCVYWSQGIVRGFMGLTATGPDKASKVGPAAEIEVRKITSVIECTPEAIAAWEAAPWSK